MMNMDQDQSAVQFLDGVGQNCSSHQYVQAESSAVSQSNQMNQNNGNIQKPSGYLHNEQRANIEPAHHINQAITNQKANEVHHSLDR